MDFSDWIIYEEDSPRTVAHALQAPRTRGADRSMAMLLMRQTSDLLASPNPVKRIQAGGLMDATGIISHEETEHLRSLHCMVPMPLPLPRTSNPLPAFDTTAPFPFPSDHTRRDDALLTNLPSTSGQAITRRMSAPRASRFAALPPTTATATPPTADVCEIKSPTRGTCIASCVLGGAMAPSDPAHDNPIKDLLSPAVLPSTADTTTVTDLALHPTSHRALDPHLESVEGLNHKLAAYSSQHAKATGAVTRKRGCIAPPVSQPPTKAQRTATHHKRGVTASSTADALASPVKAQSVKLGPHGNLAALGPGRFIVAGGSVMMLRNKKSVPAPPVNVSHEAPAAAAPKRVSAGSARHPLHAHDTCRDEEPLLYYPTSPCLFNPEEYHA